MAENVTNGKAILALIVAIAVPSLTFAFSIGILFERVAEMKAEQLKRGTLVNSIPQLEFRTTLVERDMAEIKVTLSRILANQEGRKTTP